MSDKESPFHAGLPILSVYISGYKNLRNGVEISTEPRRADDVYAHPQISQVIADTLKKLEVPPANVISISAAPQLHADVGSIGFWIFYRNPAYVVESVPDEI